MARWSHQAKRAASLLCCNMQDTMWYAHIFRRWRVVVSLGRFQLSCILFTAQSQLILSVLTYFNSQHKLHGKCEMSFCCVVDPY